VQDIRVFAPAEDETGGGVYGRTLPSENAAEFSISPDLPDSGGRADDPNVCRAMHELNNLLGVINVYSELLNGSSLDDRQRRAVGKIRSAAVHAGTVAQRLVELWARHVDLSNREGGSRTKYEERTSSIARSNAHGARILVVDDNEDTASAWRTALEVLGYDVRVAHDGPEAIRIAKSFMPLVALLDIGLPDMSGYQVAGRLLENNEPTHPLHLVAVTGYGLESDRKRSGDVGFEKHLVKPVDLNKLLNVVKELAG